MDLVLMTTLLRLSYTVLTLFISAALLVTHWRRNGSHSGKLIFWMGVILFVFALHSLSNIVYLDWLKVSVNAFRYSPGYFRLGILLFLFLLRLSWLVIRGPKEERVRHK